MGAQKMWEKASSNLICWLDGTIEGTTMIDRSGNGNDFIIQPLVPLMVASSKNYFDSADWGDSRPECLNTSILDGSELTIAIKFKLTSSIGTDAIIAKRGSNYNPSDLFVFSYNNGITLDLPTSSQRVSIGFTPLINTTYYMTLVINKQTQKTKAFIDGKSYGVYNSNFGNTNKTCRLSLLGDTANASYLTKGEVHSFKIFNEALTDEAVIADYRRETLSPIQDGLICWVDGADGKEQETSLIDRTGNGNNFLLEHFDFENYGWTGSALSIKASPFVDGSGYNTVHMTKPFHVACKSFCIHFRSKDVREPWYIFDGRRYGADGTEGSANNYCFKGGTGSTYDSTKTRKNGALKGSNSDLGNGEDAFMYFELHGAERFSMTLLGRHSQSESLGCDFYTMYAYDRALTEEEILHNMEIAKSIERGATLELIRAPEHDPAFDNYGPNGFED